MLIVIEQWLDLMLNIITQIVLPIGRVSDGSFRPLGTAFMVRQDGLFVTARHVIGNSDANLMIGGPQVNDWNLYQDTTDQRYRAFPVHVIEVDPFRDLVVLEAQGIDMRANIPRIGSFDDTRIGDTLAVVGFPHLTDGRRVLTFQQASLGAKVLLATGPDKSKYGIINSQARPGQSGSPVINVANNTVAGILIGAYAPTSGGLRLGDIDPRELHQTTHCISAAYLTEMIRS